MTGEPELQPFTSEGTWVPYLAQLLNYQGYWSGSTSQAEFDQPLCDAVIAFKTAQNLHPLDGVVTAYTWQALTTATPVTHAAAAQPAAAAEPQDAAAQPIDAAAPAQDAAAQPAASAQPPAAGQAMQSHPIEAHTVPATMDVDGLPAVSYSLSSAPIAYAEFVTPAGQVELQLSLTGSGTVSFPHGLPVTVTPESISTSVTQAVHGFTQGISVAGLPGENVTITDSMGSTYTGMSVSFDPATEAVVFHGEVHGAFDTTTDSGAAHVTGSFGFNLSVRVHGGQPQEQEVPVQDTSTFFERHHEALMIGAVVALVAVAVVVEVATDGAGSAVALALARQAMTMAASATAVAGTAAAVTE